ncbi:5'-methylthioadenosine/adenosylhomocysteine nucleosidase [Vulgatibacter sp.]|uniref:5'-methylthioadenosine/adenosylhomocysteine nucleosidase n=1 Tax=Vulgatibacter sp. TaxID=1971226 RepID=UPI0035652919
MAIGIMGAMEEEIAGLIEAMGPDRSTKSHGGRTYHRGSLFGREAVVVFSRWGKVAAATTATHLLVAEDVREILFTGVAGGADPGLRVGDVVVAASLVQHDMNAAPLFPRHEIPLLGRSAFATDEARTAAALAAARRFLASPPQAGAAFGIEAPRAVLGAIASGDKFFADRSELLELCGRLPGLACVEMEGAAVAQVCHEYGVPLTVIRTISDAADEGAPHDFARFVADVASRWSVGILRELLAGT